MDSRGECICPFCSQMSPVVVTTTFAPGMRPVLWNIALSYLVLAVLAVASSLPTGLMKRVCWSSFRSKELSNLVMARPAGFSLWATPNRRLVVRANQASRKVSDLVFPAPKTPAIADVERPDCRAETMDRAIERIWALSVPAAVHSCLPKPVAWGQYRGVSAVAKRPNSALTSITFVMDHTNKPRALPEGAFCGACRLWTSSSAPSKW